MPHGRAVWHSNGNAVKVIVNDEDHLRIEVDGPKADIPTLYKRLVQVTNHMENKVQKYQRTKRLGYLTTDPAKLGTSFSCEMHMIIPQLAVDLTKLKVVAEKF